MDITQAMMTVLTEAYPPVPITMSGHAEKSSLLDSTNDAAILKRAFILPKMDLPITPSTGRYFIW